MKKIIAYVIGVSLVWTLGSPVTSSGQEKSAADSQVIGTVVFKPLPEARIKDGAVYLKPGPLKPGKVAGEFLLGGVGVALFGLAGGSIGSGVAHSENSDGFGVPDVGASLAPALGYLLGSNLGCALGVYLIGNSGGETGSFAATFGGSLAGGLLTGGLAVAIAQANKNNHISSPALVIATAVGQTAGAVLAFNSTRKKRVQVLSGALLNLDEGKLAVSFPQVNICPGSKSSSGYKVNLFQAKF